MQEKEKEVPHHDVRNLPKTTSESRLEIDVGVVVAGLENLLEVGSLGLDVYKRQGIDAIGKLGLEVERLGRVWA